MDETTGLLAGQKLVITGVLMESSIAFAVAKLAQQQGASVLLTAMGKTIGITRRIAGRLPEPAEVIELDVTSPEDLDSLPARVADAGFDKIDGVLHAIAYAPPGILGGGFLEASWEDVATAFQVSTYSLVALARALLPQLTPGACIVGLDFDATRAWPGYDWMGVAKAGLESACRYLARDLGPQGIRVNLVAAGPIKTPAARGIPGFSDYEGLWTDKAPLGWDINDSDPTARACIALLSPWFPATTGSIVHVDGGVHAMGG